MKTIVSLVLLAALATGCGRNSNEPQSKVTANATKVYSKAELDGLILPGMSIADVTNTVGIPASETQIKEGVVSLMYTFPIETIAQEEGPHMMGFDVHTKDGKVVVWSPIMGETRKMFQDSEGTHSTSEEQAFKIVLVTDNLTNLVNTVDSQGSADASSLTGSPNMAFKAQVFAGTSGNERPGEQTVILVMSEQDASKLKNLSESNVGKRLLIVCRNRVIAAPAISAPLSSGQLIFTVKDSHVLDSLRSK